MVAGIIIGVIAMQIITFLVWALSGQDEEIALLGSLLIPYGITRGIYNVATRHGRQRIYKFFAGTACMWDADTQAENKVRLELRRFGFTKKWKMTAKEADELVENVKMFGRLGTAENTRKVSRNQRRMIIGEKCFH